MAAATPIAFSLFDGAVEKTNVQVVEVEFGMDGRFSTSLVRVPATAIEGWSGIFNPDDRLYVKRDTEIVLKGRALTPNVAWDPNSEEITATIVGAEWDLERGHLWGQKAPARTGGEAIFTGLPCVFNPDGVANRYAEDLDGSWDLETGDEYSTDVADEPQTVTNGATALTKNAGGAGSLGSDEWDYDSGTGKLHVNIGVDPSAGDVAHSSSIFQPDRTASSRKHWAVKHMVEYVLAVFADEVEDDVVDADGISWPSGLDTLLVWNVNVQGATYREALTTILSRAGYGWSLRAKDTEDDDHEVLIFRKGDSTGGTTKDVHLPARGSNLGDMTADQRAKAVPAGHLQLDHTSVATKLIGYGNVKVFESEWTLRKGWSAADETSAFGSGTTREQVGNLKRATSRDFTGFEALRNVGRRYVLNETGNVDTNPATSAWDFDSLLGADKYSKRPRPFLPNRITKDADGNPLPFQVYIDDDIQGGGSDDVLGKYVPRLLADIAGIYFEGEFPYNDAIAIREDDPEAGWPTSVRIVAAIESDEAVSSEEEPTADLTTPVVRVLDLTARFSWDNVYGDTAELDDFVDAKAAEVAKLQAVGRLTLEEITEFDAFWPGEWITSIGGRSISFDAQIVGLRWDVLGGQKTEIFTETMEADIVTDRPEAPLSRPPAPRARGEVHPRLPRHADFAPPAPGEIHPPFSGRGDR